MSVKFKPTQIAMPLSANYGRWYAKMVISVHAFAFPSAASSWALMMASVFASLPLVRLLGGAIVRFWQRMCSYYMEKP